MDFETDNKNQEIGAKAYDFIFRNAKSYCRNHKKIQSGEAKTGKFSNQFLTHFFTKYPKTLWANVVDNFVEHNFYFIIFFVMSSVLAVGLKLQSSGKSASEAVAVWPLRVGQPKYA